MGSYSYIEEAIKNLKGRLEKDGLEFNNKLSDPLYRPAQGFSKVKYRPALDTSTECTETQHTLYQNLIGILRWVVEIGRIDIGYEVSLLSRYLA